MTPRLRLLAASLAAPWLPVRLRRVMARRLGRTTLVLSVRLTAAGELHVGGARLRVFGIRPSTDVSALRLAIEPLLFDDVARVRVVMLNSDGALAAIIRVGGRDLGDLMLRDGLALVRGTGNNRYRQAQTRAQTLRLGIWCRFECAAVEPESQLCECTGVFPWWQG